MSKRDYETNLSRACSSSCSHYSYLRRECLSRVVRILDTKGQPVELGNNCLHPGTYTNNASTTRDSYDE